MIALVHEIFQLKFSVFSSQPLVGPPAPSPDDKLVMAKHQSIYPSEAELTQVQTIVGATEKALKLVSDAIAGTCVKRDVRYLLNLWMLYVITTT